MNKKKLKLKQELLLDVKEKLEKVYELDKDDIDINSYKDDIEKKLIQVEYKLKYDIELKNYEIRRTDWICIERLKGIIYIGKGMNVLNSKEQPRKDETLIQFAYPTGAYIFGGGWFPDVDDYDSELFDEFFEELKTYNYKYIDELNSCLYFNMENGIKLFKNYDEIFKKYQDMWNERKKVRKIKALKEELEILGDKE